MKQFRKRTIALVLASAMTIAGSFAAEQYKNTLMGLSFKFDETGSGALNMLVQTRTTYQGNVTPIKKDENTYVLMLPEVMSEAAVPNLNDFGGSIENVRINTLPYTNTGKGYTRIVIKTNNVPSMSGSNAIYIPSKEQKAISTSQGKKENISQNSNNYQRQNSSYATVPNREQERKKYSYEPEAESNVVVEQPTTEEMVKPVMDNVDSTNDFPEEDETTYTPESSSDPTETILLLLGFLLVCACAVYFYTKAKNKLTEIAGESLKIDVSEEKTEQNKKQKKSDKIKKTINKLDAAYSRTAVPKKNEYKKSIAPVEEQKSIEEVNVVDLDALFKETVNSKEQQEDEAAEEENLALEEFLSGFSFDEELVEEEISAGYDIDFYEEVLKSQKIKFSDDDIQCINKLLSSEIDDSTLKNLENYLVSNPIKKKKISKKQLLEEFVTTYAISQNITFTRDDVNALYKILNVEIDSDFITDLKTNPERTKEMQKELEMFNSELKTPSKIKTLSVHNMLPDLAEAVKKQAGKKIESEVKKEVVYYSEGYEVDKLVVDLDLPDLSKEINNKSAYTSKPSAAYQIVDDTYSVEALKLSSDLPDLKDALIHPEKYEEQPKEPVVVDEKALLDNISNVSFKPFYDGTQDFEVINTDIMETPTVDSVLQEMSQFENIEIVQTKENKDIQSDTKTIDTSVQEENRKNESANVVVEKPVQLEEIAQSASVEKTPSPKGIVQPKRAEKAPERVPRRERSEISAELLEKISQRRKEQELRKKEASHINREAKRNVTENAPKDLKCILDGESYNVLSSVRLTEDAGCHLAKNSNGYMVIGYINEQLYALKRYAELKSEKIQARKGDLQPDGSTNYIVRIGISKFIIKMSSDKIKFIMDLC